MKLCDSAEQRVIKKWQNLKKEDCVGGTTCSAVSMTGTFILKTKKAYAMKELKEYRFPVNAYFKGGKKTPKTSKTKRQNIS